MGETKVLLTETDDKEALDDEGGEDTDVDDTVELSEDTEAVLETASEVLFAIELMIKEASETVTEEEVKWEEELLDDTGTDDSETERADSETDDAETEDDAETLVGETVPQTALLIPGHCRRVVTCQARTSVPISGYTILQ